MTDCVLNKYQQSFFIEIIQLESRISQKLDNELIGFGIGRNIEGKKEFLFSSKPNNTKGRGLLVAWIALLEISKGSRKRIEWIQKFFKRGGGYDKYLSKNRINAFYRPSGIPNELDESTEWARRLKRDFWRTLVSLSTGRVSRKFNTSQDVLKKSWIRIINNLIDLVNGIKCENSFKKAITLCTDMESRLINGKDIDILDRPYYHFWKETKDQGYFSMLD